MRWNVARVEGSKKSLFGGEALKIFRGFGGGGCGALDLSAAELGQSFDAFAIEASFLDVQVAKLLFVGQVGLQEDFAVAFLRRGVGEDTDV